MPDDQGIRVIARRLARDRKGTFGTLEAVGPRSIYSPTAEGARMPLAREDRAASPSRGWKHFSTDVDRGVENS